MILLEVDREMHKLSAPKRTKVQPALTCGLVFNCLDFKLSAYMHASFKGDPWIVRQSTLLIFFFSTTGTSLGYKTRGLESWTSSQSLFTSMTVSMSCRWGLSMTASSLPCMNWRTVATLPQLGIARKATSFSHAVASNTKTEKQEHPSSLNTKKSPISMAWSTTNSFHPLSNRSPFELSTSSTSHILPLGPLKETIPKDSFSKCTRKAGGIFYNKQNNLL